MRRGKSLKVSRKSTALNRYTISGMHIEVKFKKIERVERKQKKRDLRKEK